MPVRGGGRAAAPHRDGQHGGSSGVEEMVWEQFTVTLQRDSKMGFGIAVSGGRDNPNVDNGETSIIVSDVLKGGPADGLLFESDRVLQVNSTSMDNVPHSFAVQSLRKCGKVAKIIVKRPRKVSVHMKQPPSPGAESREYTPSGHYYDADNDNSWYRDESRDHLEPEYRPGQDYNQRGRSRGRSPERGSSLDRPRREGSRDRTLDRSREPSPGLGGRFRSRDRLNDNSPSPELVRDLETLEKPVNVLLVKNRPSEEYGLRLGSQIFIKQMTSTGLASKDGNLHEGDIILKINGTVTENLSLHDAGKLIEKSRGKLQLLVQRDRRQILVRIPPLADSDSDNDELSEMDSSSSPPEDRRSHQSDLSSHSSNDRDNIREEPTCTAKMAAMASPFRVPEESPAPGTMVTPKILLRPTSEDSSPDTVMVTFLKGDSVGLRLAGGNGVGIFIAGVQEGSPAEEEGLRVGDQILKVNNMDFGGVVREEAVLFLLEIPKGELVTILAQSRPDVFKDILESGLGDSFFIRTHFDYEKETPQSLAFSRGHVFKVVDTLYDGKLGNWLAIRVGKDQQLLEKGIIPNRSRAEQLFSVQSSHRVSGTERSDFWRIRGQRSLKRKESKRIRENPNPTTLNSRFQAYERVVLREAGFRRPVVLLGPIADAATERLSSEMPDLFVVAKTEPKDAGCEKTSGIVRLNTIRQIIEQDRHALLDVTPRAVETLNSTQWYPIVIFLNPDSKHGVKALRQRLRPQSTRSTRRLHQEALKLRKSCPHLFTASIDLNWTNDSWYGSLKDCIREQQEEPVWVSEGKLELVQTDPVQTDPVQTDPVQTLDCCPDPESLSFLSAASVDYLSLDGRLTSDPDDTADDEGDAQQRLEPAHVSAHVSAIARSSEPVRVEEIIRGHLRKVGCRDDLKRSSPPAAPVLEVKLSQRDPPQRDPLQRNLPAHHHHHHHHHHLHLRQHHRSPPPSRCYDSPSSSSPASSSNDPPPVPLCQPAAPFLPPLPPPPPPAPHLTSFSQPQALGGEGAERVGAQGLEEAEDPSLRSFLGKIKAFEKMDHFARSHRLLQLQQAQEARLELVQTHPDLYAVPLKTAKLDHSRPQPIGSSSGSCPEPSKEGQSFSSEGLPGLFTANSLQYPGNLTQYQDTEL